LPAARSRSSLASTAGLSYRVIAVVFANAPMVLAPDEDQASAGARSEAVPLLRPRTGSSDGRLLLSTLDARRLGMRVQVDEQAVRGVDVEPGDSERGLDELRAAGATVG
jgi:hypothetical protein